MLTLLMVYGAVAPFQFHGDRALAARKLARVRLNPLISPDTGLRASLPDLTQNILLFLPFGAVGALVLKRGPATTRPSGVTMAGVAVAAAATSVGFPDADVALAEAVRSVLFGVVTFRWYASRACERQPRGRFRSASSQSSASKRVKSWWNRGARGLSMPFCPP